MDYYELTQNISRNDTCIESAHVISVYEVSHPLLIPHDNGIT